MNAIAGIPYCQACFDKDGNGLNQVTIPPNVTDLFVMSHGWNNNAAEAEQLFQGFFESFGDVVPASLRGDKYFAIIGVIWPSKRFDELVAVSGQSGGATGAAGLGQTNAAESIDAVSKKLDGLKHFFTEPAQHAAIDRAKSLLPRLEDQAAARISFVEAVQSLVDPSAATAEDASDEFFRTEGNELMKRLKVADDDLDEELAPGGGASMPLGTSSANPAGGAVGFLDFLHGFKAAAMNVLNFTTYYEMKARAGTVGKKGVTPLVDQLAQQAGRVHLIGHSFGGRLVTAIAANSATQRIKSMTLLQAAYSHNGLSKIKHGFFRSVIDRLRVDGPILITHTRNDKAVGIAYPLASRISGQTAAALGDEHDEYGGMGRNGAQNMGDDERVVGKLLAVGLPYHFARRKCFNLEASAFISGHGDVKGKQVAYALWQAIQ
jgi:predicted alpha/beta hydrolase family esterase